MESHPSYTILSPVIAKYPRVGGAMFLTYNDLVHTQRWKDVEILELPRTDRVALRGKRPETSASHTIVPCLLAESLSIEWLENVFEEVNEQHEIYMGILSDDSSIVYYRISKGIVKPPS
ncbi:hypothetical protein M422DRAFT_25276 [Sphaerobolus stellatus SS14]|nr:hypothetical protein M422DRAFT_25276 [Sphaerobolus stellatus SS14]